MNNEAYMNLYLVGYAVIGLISITGLIYTLFLVLRFDLIRDWFNRKAGEEILHNFTFRPLRTLFVTACIAFILFQIVLLLILIPGVSEAIENDTLSTTLACVAAVAIYPMWRIVRRIHYVFFADGNRRSRIWRLVYDVLMNLSIIGGYMVYVIIAFIAVLLSFTKWNNVIPEKLRNLTGVDVVPESRWHYIFGAGAGLLLIFSEFMGDTTQETLAVVIAFGLILSLIYMLVKLIRAKGVERRKLAWKYGYMLLTTFAVFVLFSVLIIFTIIFVILKFALKSTFSPQSSSGGSSGVTGNSSDSAHNFEHQCGRCAHFDSNEWQCGLFHKPTKYSDSCSNFQYR